MKNEDLIYISAMEAARLFRQHKLSPVELMSAVIERAETVEKKINAFTFKHYDEAMDLAKAAEAKFMKRDGKVGALEGLPVAIKDESWIAGKPTSYGSLTTKDFVPDKTSANNERILKAGGIVHARTATPEFSCASYTHSRLWGVTRNPWNRKFTPGGSSGGSGASLAAGTSLLAMGSDIGGSIRIPAAACGVVGYKPPYGRNPDDAPFNLDPYCHTGPMARTIADAILLQNVISGPSSTDIASLRPKLRLPMEYKPIKGWKIAYSLDLGIYDVDQEVIANTQKALRVFRGLGATVEEVDLGWTRNAIDSGMWHLEHLFGTLLNQTAKKHANLMTVYARNFARKGSKSTAALFFRSMECATMFYDRFVPMMEKYYLFFCPSSALPAV